MFIDTQTVAKQSLCTYRIWGLFDAFYIAWMCITSWKTGRVPYISDAQSTLSLLEQQGGSTTAIVAASWLLQTSIVATCMMFLCRIRLVKFLAYAQIPLRLFFLVPSVSLILATAKLTQGLGQFFLLLIIASEALKGWTLWRLK
ncbi:hypothetical protein WG219_20790 [Ectopseudomonas mendocina]|uniref:Uncharacterized protein n=1 Tax=Ectopseudomonas mendocina TaxID=300 RepID=A0ABZ2RGJ9_ECTME